MGTISDRDLELEAKFSQGYLAGWVESQWDGQARDFRPRNKPSEYEIRRRRAERCVKRWMKRVRES